MVYTLNEWYNAYIYNSKMTKISKFLKNGQNLNPKLVLESVLDTDSKNGFGFLWWLQKVQFFLLPKSAIFSTLGNSKNGTFGAQHKKPKPVLESVNKTDYKTGFGF